MQMIDADKAASCKEECARTTPLRPAPTPSADDYIPQQRSMAHVFLVPLLGFCVIGVAAVAFAMMRRRRDAEWASSGFGGVDVEEPSADERLAGAKYPTIEAAIAGARGKDQAFSWVLFEDFVYALYSEAHTLRGAGKLATLSGYFAPAALATLGRLPVAPVKGIIIGSLRTEDVRVDDLERRVGVTMSFESNYTEGDRSYYVRERWKLSRSVDAPSRPLERSRTIDCPNCGAPLDKTIAGKCSYCNTVSGEGSLDWRVDTIEGVEREVRGPILVGTTQEVGTGLPTVVAPDVKQRWAGLAAKDPGVTWALLVARIETTFASFHASCSAQDLTAVRPFLSDNLFETQKYWVSAYRSEGLRNLTDGAKVATIHLSRVTNDALFDLVTVRVYASCLDYTLNAAGECVGGSTTETRNYSEYWTFIRGAGARGAPRADAICPSCGADAKGISMAGVCGHCSAKVTSGAFDWVLSRIEQDEVYDIA